MRRVQHGEQHEQSGPRPLLRTADHDEAGFRERDGTGDEVERQSRPAPARHEPHPGADERAAAAEPQRGVHDEVRMQVAAQQRRERHRDERAPDEADEEEVRATRRTAAWTQQARFREEQRRKREQGEVPEVDAVGPEQDGVREGEPDRVEAHGDLPRARQACERIPHTAFAARRRAIAAASSPSTSRSTSSVCWPSVGGAAW